MPEEKLEFSAADLGRLAAHVTGTERQRDAAVADIIDWLASQVTGPTHALDYHRMVAEVRRGAEEA